MQRQGVVREFGAMSFMWRFAASMLLIFSTYNPTSFSYYIWLSNGITNRSLGPGHFVVGMLLIIGWSILVVATQRSLGTVGSVLAAALIGGVIWWLTDIGWLAVGTVSALTWVSIVCLSLLLAVGLSWSHIWRRLTGQYEVDDTDG